MDGWMRGSDQVGSPPSLSASLLPSSVPSFSSQYSTIPTRTYDGMIVDSSSVRMHVYRFALHYLTHTPFEQHHQ